MRSPQNIEAVTVAKQRSPGKLTWKARAQIRVSRQSVQQILHSDMHLYLYKVTMVNEPTARNKQQRMEFVVRRHHEEVIMCNAWFKDEVHFHLDGTVNKQNIRS
jgi:hypothetical protein